MRAQGKPSAHLEGDVVACDYRSQEDLRCAVGALFQDSEYSHNMENRTVRELAESGLLSARLWGKLSILEQLQHVHDTAAASNLRSGIPFWQEFKMLALEAGLDTRVLQD